MPERRTVLGTAFAGALGALALAQPWREPYSWEGRLPSEFALFRREIDTPLRVAWKGSGIDGGSTWRYAVPLDLRTTDARLAPIVAGWSVLPPSRGRGYEREPDGPSIRSFDLGDHTEVVACGERIKPTLLASWLAKLPLDRMGMMPSRNTKVWIVRHGSPYPVRRSTKSTGVSSGRPSLRPLPPVTKPAFRGAELVPHPPAR